MYFVLMQLFYFFKIKFNKFYFPPMLTSYPIFDYTLIGD